ncbi:DUF6531 domain-containing protein [Nocardioides ungokensis]|uniref:DUF6531 domain-containing protein n=1 Tax=Nocardioides ungokensis TaxID=1643322 RepID=UPI001FEA9A3A|nr:DUF6531 domain-containing protein [Nocardioides ungokensis]
MENESDLAFTDATSHLALTRTYNSFNPDTGAFGPGWSSITEARLDLTDDAARLTHPDGRVTLFPRLGNGWDRATGQNMWLEQTTGEGLGGPTAFSGSRTTTAGGGTTPPPATCSPSAPERAPPSGSLIWTADSLDSSTSAAAASTSSGTGTGSPLLVPRTAARSPMPTTTPDA